MNWLNRLDIKDIWGAVENEGINAQELARRMAARIKTHKLYRRDEQLQSLADEFDTLAGDASTTFDDTDAVYEALCEWGDQPDFNIFTFERGNHCWIATF